jgi:oligosaccharyltransferase complex subunit beta
MLEFVDTNHNIFLVSSTTLSNELRELATDSGLQIDEEGTTVFDHFQFEKEKDKEQNHNVIYSNDYPYSKTVLGDKVSKPILFKG